MLERLITTLRSAGVDFDALEVADAIWLAAQIGPAAPAATPSSRVAQEPAAPKKEEVAAQEEEKAKEFEETEKEEEPPEKKQRPERGRPERNLYPDFSGRTPGTGGRRGAQIRSPGFRALSDSLQISRALRPLRRRVRSVHRVILDERATAERIAEAGMDFEGPWLPVLQPAPERWLSLALVVDSSPSMQPWAKAVAELKGLLQELGAFRELRFWALESHGAGAPFISLTPGAPPRSARELLDPAGRRLVLVVTDSVAATWYEAGIKELLDVWARRQPVAILQLLPQRLWSQTGFSTVSTLQVRARRPGEANLRINVEDREFFDPQEEDGWPPIPLTSVEPRDLMGWAAFVAGESHASVPAAIFYPEDESKSERPAPELSAEERIRRFSIASPTAFELACLLSAVLPSTLPVMRLIQGVMLPDSDASHLAEIFLGDLVRESDIYTAAAGLEETCYEFYPGVPALLRRHAVLADLDHVQRILTRYVSERVGQGGGFSAVVEDSRGFVELPEGGKAFARVAGGGGGASAATGLLERPRPVYSAHIHTLTSLNRLASRRPQSENLLRELFDGRVEELALAALEVAVESGDPIGRILADYVEEMSSELRRAVMEWSNAGANRFSVPLREVALAATRRLLEERLAEGAESTAERRAKIAALQLNLGLRLGGLGHWEEAVESIRRAVDTYRAEKADSFSAGLASSLTHLSEALGELGRPEESFEAANEAVEIFRQLSTAEPVQVDLANSITELSRSLKGLGRYEESLAAAHEAVAIRRELLAGESPDGVSQSHLAQSLFHLGRSLGALGRPEEALRTTAEAVEIYRQLAVARPDAFLPDLAEGLSSFSESLAGLDRWEEALAAAREAAQIQRELVDQRPERFTPALAKSLVNLSLSLSAKGEKEEALDLGQKVLDIYRRLAAQRPDAFLPGLASSLANLSALLGELGHIEEAVGLARECVGLQRSLAGERPEVFLPDLASSLSNLSILLRAVGRNDEAVDLARESLELHRRLAVDRSPAPALARRLDDLGSLLDELAPDEGPETEGSTETEVSNGDEEPPYFWAQQPTLVLQMQSKSAQGHVLLEYRLRGSFGELVWKKRLDTDPLTYIEGLFERIEAIGSDSSEEAARRSRRQLDGLGGTLADRLLPTGLRERLLAEAGSELSIDASAPTLWVISDEPWIPWEMLRLRGPAGEGPCLAELFALTRWSWERAAARRFPLGRIGLVIPDPVISGLPATVGERADVLAHRQEGEREVEEVSARYNDVVDHFVGGGFSGWHFSGHALAVKETPDLSGLLLDDDRLEATDLRTSGCDLSGDQPLVFLNACRSTHMNLSLSGLGGLAEAFLEIGAGALIGTYWTVEDKRARAFARAFYEFFLVLNEPIGEAARQARLWLRTAFPGDTTWLAYSVYAHPLAAVDGPSELAPPVRRPVPHLEVPQYEWVPHRSPPGALLRADHGTVPFNRREKELEDLFTWCGGEQKERIRLYTGVGGMGKTRLALEVCLRMRAQGWRTGLIESAADANPEETARAILAAGGPMLLVLDYAETRRKFLVPLLRELLRTEAEGPFRLILIARWREDWWEQLRREPEGVGDLIAGPATEHYALSPLALTVEQRATTWRIAARAFADRLQTEVPEYLPEDLDAEYFEPVLILHMSALGAVEGMPLKGEDGILDWVLDRERRFWSSQLRERKLNQHLIQGVGRAMSAITLAGGTVSESGTVNLLKELEFFQGQPTAVLTEVARLMHDTYPGNYWVMPVQPDILAEHLIERELVENPQEIFDLVLGPRSEEETREEVSES